MSTFSSDPELPRSPVMGCLEETLLELDVAHDMMRPVVRFSLDSKQRHLCVELSPAVARLVSAALVRQAEEAERSA